MAHDSLISMDITPQTEPRNTAHRSKFQTVLAAGVPSRRRGSSNKDKDMIATPSPLLLQKESPALNHKDASESPLLYPRSPTLTLSSDPLESEPSSPDLALRQVPPSPYDPLVTPSFRHSSPRLPSDQPWRFPSPSHPLHSSLEFSLSMLSGEPGSPVTVTLSAPNTNPVQMQTPLPSPRARNARRSYSDDSEIFGSARERRSTPKGLFSVSPLPLRVTSRMTRQRYEESPLAHVTRARTISLSEGWPSEDTLTVGLGNKALVPDRLPFYDSWEINEEGHNGGRDRYSPPSPTTREGDSPVLRSSALSTSVGLGIGLLDPFILRGDQLYSIEDDFQGMMDPLHIENDDEAEVANTLTLLSDRSGVTPPFKKRRTTFGERD